MKKHLLRTVIALVFLSILTAACTPQDRYRAENIMEGRITHIPYSYYRPIVPTYISFLEDGKTEGLRITFEDAYLSDADDPNSTVTVCAIIYDERGRVTTPGAIRTMQRVQIGYDIEPTDTNGGETAVLRFVRILESRAELMDIYLWYTAKYINSAQAISIENETLLTEKQRRLLVRECEELAGKALPLVTYRKDGKSGGYYDENGTLYGESKGKLIIGSQIDEDGNCHVSVSLYYAPLGAYGYSIQLAEEENGRWSVIGSSNWIS